MQEKTREQAIQELAGFTARRMTLIRLLEEGTDSGAHLHAFWQRVLAPRFKCSFETPGELARFLRERCIELDFEVCDLSHGFQEEIRAADSETLGRWYREAFGKAIRLV